MASNDVFVSTQWLAERLDAPDIVVVDGSWYLPAHARDPAAEYAETLAKARAPMKAAEDAWRFTATTRGQGAANLGADGKI